MSIPTPSPDDRQQAPSTEQTPGEAGALNADLLEEVLKETIAAADLGSSDGESLAILTQVAGRHQGQALTLEPVMVDLVRSLLKNRFRSLPDKGPLWQEMTLQIAETLLDDPATHSRLQDLWRRVTEAVR